MTGETKPPTMLAGTALETLPLGITALLDTRNEPAGSLAPETSVAPDTSLAPETSAVATLRVGIAAFSAGDTLLFCNPRFADLLGLPTAQLQPGLPFAACLRLMADQAAGPENAQFVAAQRHADRSQSSFVRRIRANGQVIDISSDPLADGGWTMTVSDVGALARAEDEERRRAKLLRSILDAIPHGVCVYGSDRRVTMFNRAYGELMTGAPLVVGEHVEDIIRRRAAAGEYGAGDADEIFAQQMAFDVSRPQMRKRRRPNGMTVDVRTSPLPEGGYISVVTDITPLTAAEAEVSRRAEELAVMLACIRHGVLLWGPDRRLLASNAIAAELLHHPPGLLTPGRSQDEILSSMLRGGQFDPDAAGQQSAGTLANLDRSEPYLRQVVTRAGRVLDVRADPTPGGGWVSTLTDVTEARAAQEESRRAREAAEAANQAKSRFLATMSHELRTPLNLIIGFSDALMREAAIPLTSQIAEFAVQINQAGRHLLDLINVILDVARIESGRFDLAADQVDVARLVRLTLRHADAAAQAAEVTFRLELPEDLPRVRADERRLQQVLNHLLSNAIKFTHAGGSVSIAASASPESGLCLSVRDTGIGIPPDELERVFEPFTQVDNSLARRFQGAGLGLYMSRALIAGHGGELLLHSTRDEGTVVEIRLPPKLLVFVGPASDRNQTP